MPADLLVAERLTRRFAGRVAVRDLSLTLRGGEIVSLLGPNGAGKTTTLRMLAGLLPPTGGRVLVNQQELSASGASAARGSIGLLTEAPGLWERLTVHFNLLTYARLQGVTSPDARVARTLADVGLEDRAGDTAGTLSKGLKQRVAIARALVHDPPVVLLDEPTSGLDPASARQVRDLIAALRAAGRAVLVSTHNLAEAEALSDRIAVLKTQLLALDTPAALRRSGGDAMLTIEVEGPAAPWIERLDDRATADGSTLTIPLRDAGEIPDLVARLAVAGARIVRVTPEQRSLEQVYLDLVGAA